MDAPKLRFPDHRDHGSCYIIPERWTSAYDAWRKSRMSYGFMLKTLRKYEYYISFSCFVLLNFNSLFTKLNWIIMHFHWSFGQHAEMRVNLDLSTTFWWAIHKLNDVKNTCWKALLITKGSVDKADTTSSAHLGFLLNIVYSFSTTYKYICCIIASNIKRLVIIKDCLALIKVKRIFNQKSY